MFPLLDCLWVGSRAHTNESAAKVGIEKLFLALFQTMQASRFMPWNAHSPPRPRSRPRIFTDSEDDEEDFNRRHL
jgi:hypothetical protein